MGLNLYEFACVPTGNEKIFYASPDFCGNPKASISADKSARIAPNAKGTTGPKVFQRMPAITLAGRSAIPTTVE
jgi:hypothetical protein